MKNYTINNKSAHIDEFNTYQLIESYFEGKHTFIGDNSDDENGKSFLPDLFTSDYSYGVEVTTCELEIVYRLFEHNTALLKEYNERKQVVKDIFGKKNEKFTKPKLKSKHKVTFKSFNYSGFIFQKLKIDKNNYQLYGFDTFSPLSKTFKRTTSFGIIKNLIINNNYENLNNLFLNTLEKRLQLKLKKAKNGNYKNVQTLDLAIKSDMGKYPFLKDDELFSFVDTIRSDPQYQNTFRNIILILDDRILDCNAKTVTQIDKKKCSLYDIYREAQLELQEKYKENTNEM